MSRMKWDQTAERIYETGVKDAALFVQSEGKYGAGVPWNGFISFTESPSGAEPTALYANDRKYANLMSAEEYGFSMEAYTYPDEFAECDGSATIATGVTIGQQKRKTFGFVCKTTIGNDVDGNSYGYKLHIVYGALAAPSEKAHTTINDSPEAMTMSWECSTTPVSVDGFDPTACITIDSTKFTTEDMKAKLKALEDYIYGKDGDEVSEPALPMPEKVVELIGSVAAG